MKSLLPAFIIGCMTLVFSGIRAQELISIQQTATLDLDGVAGVLGTPGTFEVETYKVTHTVIDDRGELDTISGLITRPVNAADARALVLYSHGTSDDIQDVPSLDNSGYLEAVAYATSGFVCAATDYIGLGVSLDRFHPYVHAESQALANIAIAEVAFDIMDDAGIAHDRSVFLSGYSQGGHASMATQQYIATANLDITVLAAAHGSGPYSLSEVMRELVASGDDYPAGLAFIPYVIAGYQSAYGDVYSTLEDIFLPAYTSSIQSFIDYNSNLSNMGTTIGTALFFGGQSLTPANILQPSVLDAMVNADSSNLVYGYLRDNDTYDFVATAPTRLYYCEADAVVSFENAIYADSAMDALGAADVEAISLDPDAGHGECAVLAIPASIDFFTGLLPTSTSNTSSTHPVTLYPNPVSEVLYFDGMDEVEQVIVFDMQGRLIMQVSEISGGLSVKALSPGMYQAHLQTASGRVVRPFVKVD